MVFGEMSEINLCGIRSSVGSGPVLGNACEKVLFRVGAQKLVLLDKGCDSYARDREGIFDADDLCGEADADSVG
jgi:hypothetical protein